MRRLLFLFLGLALVLWGRSLLAGDSAAPEVILRDGLLVTLIGTAIFAINGVAPIRANPRRYDAGNVSPLSAAGGLMALVGLIITLLGGGWLAWAFYSGGNNGASELVIPLVLWLAGLVIGVVSGFAGERRQRPTQVEATPGVWSVESARRYLQRKQNQAARAQADALVLPKRTIRFALLAMMLVGLLVRLWNFAGLPDGCIAQECDTVVGALDFLNTWHWGNLFLTSSPAHVALTSLFLALFGVGQNSTLLLGLLLGTLAIPLAYGAASRFVSPNAALLGALIAGFGPLLIGLSRHPGPGLLLLVLVLALLALRPDEAENGSWLASGWVPLWGPLSGALAGLTLFAAPAPLAWLLFLWFVVTPPAGNTNRGAWIAYYSWLVAAALPRLAIALVAGLQSATLIENPLVGMMPQAAAQAARFLADGGLPGLLALLGSAYLLRHIRWNRGWLWSMGFLLVGLPLFVTEQWADLHFLAPLLALLGVGAVVALNQIVGLFARVWSPVLRPTPILIGAGALLVVLVAMGSVARLGDVAERASSEANGGYAAIGRYLHSRFETSVDNGGSDQTLVLVPHSILSNAATQLAAQGVLPRAAHIVPLDSVAHLPFTGPPFISQGMGDLLYILPNADSPLQRYVQTLYPGMVAEPILDGQGTSWALAYPVARGAAANAQGLSVGYFVGESGEDRPDISQEPTEIRREGPLDFQWGVAPLLSPPFVMVGSGGLYVPEGGIYKMRMVRDGPVQVHVEVGNPASPLLVLDSDTGVVEQSADLPQGFLSFSIKIDAGMNITGTASESTAGKLSVQWQRPDNEWETIPRQALYNGPVALGAGWVARYYRDGTAGDATAGDATAGDATAQGFDAGSGAQLIGWRVEPWLSDSSLLSDSGLAVWQTKLAAPLEGTYAFTLDGAGPYQLEIDGIVLVDEASGGSSSTSLLLSQGWHTALVRFRPSGAGGIQLRWRPPNAGTAGLIPLDFLAALPPDASTDALALPAPIMQDVQPALAIGNDAGSALMLSPSAQRSTGGELPVDLPDLPFTLEWQVGSCGADIEEFQQPRGVAINLFNELVYVADQGNRRVILRDLSDGGLVDFYTDESFEEPFDLDVNLLGEIFVLDAVSQTIYKFEEPAGIALAQPSDTAFYRPRGMGMDLNGDLYVADTGGGRVVKLSGSDGTVGLQIGGPDSALGQGQPVDVMTLPTGAIYAVTAQDGTLWRLDTGESWPAVAPANTFDSPHFARLTTSAFFLTDPERRLVTYYDRLGNPLGQLRSDLFVKPVGVGALILDGDVLLAVADSASCQLSLWRAPLDAIP